MPFFVYILASRPRGAIYIGSTKDLARRMEQHLCGAVAGHARRYGIRTLVWFEMHGTLEPSLVRERRIKRWRRAWKDELIESVNPAWRSLTHQIPM